MRISHWAILTLASLILVTICSYVFPSAMMVESRASRWGLTCGCALYEYWNPATLTAGMLGGGPWQMYWYSDQSMDWWGNRTGLSGTSIWLSLWLPVIFAGILAAAVCLLDTTHRRAQRRRRHGLCVQCGYDLSNRIDARCPECGATSNTVEPPALPSTDK